jgi:hypothetical protein
MPRHADIRADDRAVEKQQTLPLFSLGTGEVPGPNSVSPPRVCNTQTIIFCLHLSAGLALLEQTYNVQPKHAHKTLIVIPRSSSEYALLHHLLVPPPPSTSPPAPPPPPSNLFLLSLKTHGVDPKRTRRSPGKCSRKKKPHTSYPSRIRAVLLLCC